VRDRYRIDLLLRGDRVRVLKSEGSQRNCCHAPQIMDSRFPGQCLAEVYGAHLRFVQHFKPASEGAFKELEKEFAALERGSEGLAKERRYQPYSAREPRHTLIWQCEFPTLEGLNEALAVLARSVDHDRLFAKAAPTMIDSYTEIYEVLEM
jgi:hypothetical protein